MSAEINVDCEACNTRYRIDAEHAGKIASCYKCDEKFLLPIPCSNELLEFAKSKPWRRLKRLVSYGLLDGHCGYTRTSVLELIKHGKEVYELERRREFLATASDCDFEQLNQIINSGVLSRFSQETRDAFLELHHRSRERMIAKEHFDQYGKPMLSPLQERRAVLHRKAVRHNRLVLTVERMSPGEFEHFVADLYRAKGFDAEVTGGPHDRGIDVWDLRG